MIRQCLNPLTTSRKFLGSLPAKIINVKKLRRQHLECIFQEKLRELFRLLYKTIKVNLDCHDNEGAHVS